MPRNSAGGASCGGNGAGFNEAAASQCRGILITFAVPAVAADASMRPRHRNAAESIDVAAGHPGLQGFNEAAASQCRGISMLMIGFASAKKLQ